jgi:hypothetical protein
MYVCSKQNEEGAENPYSHMSHVSGGTPYSNNFVTFILFNATFKNISEYFRNIWTKMCKQLKILKSSVSAIFQL